MKKSALAVLTVASLAGMAGIANAIPFGPNDLPQNEATTIAQTAQGGGGTGSNLAPTFGPSIISLVNPNVTPLIAAVPEGSSSLLLLGAGLLAMAMLRRHVDHRFAD